jgi:hypothetical protein
MRPCHQVSQRIKDRTYAGKRTGQPPAERRDPFYKTHGEDFPAFMACSSSALAKKIQIRLAQPFAE